MKLLFAETVISLKIRLHNIYSIMAALAFFLLTQGCGSGTGANKNHHGYIETAVRHSGVLINDSAAYFNTIDSVFNTIAQPGNHDVWDKYYWRWCYFFYQSRNYRAALDYADSLLYFSATVGDEEERKSLTAQSLLLEGDAFFAENRYADAFDRYYRSQELILQTKDSCALGQYTDRLINIYYKQQNYKAAIKCNEQLLADRGACEERKGAKYFRQHQGTLDNIGICFVRLHMPDSALYYFNEAVAYIDDNVAKFPEEADWAAMSKAVVLGNKADAEIMKSNDSAAEELLQQAIAVNKLRGHAPEDAVYSRVKLIGLCLRHKKMQQAQELLNECAVALDTIPNGGLVASMYQLQYQYDSAIGNIPGAFEFAAKYGRQRDSLKETSVRSFTTDIEGAIDDIGRKYQVTSLQQRSKTQAVYITVLVLGVIMAAGIIVLAFKNSAQSKKHIKTLTSTMQALEKSQQDNAKLMKIVAHDLRNPVGSMTSLAELMLEDDGVSPETRKLLSLMHKSGKNASGLIDDLLHVSPSSAELITEPIDILELLQYCYLLLQQKALNKNQRIKLQGAAAIIPGDREKLWRVFSNLITNAIKFSPEDSEITITVQEKGAMAQVAIKDQGIGIPDSIKDKLFEASAIAKRRGTAGEESFGLGLMISRQIVEQHNGSIWFNSEVGKGATFYVELPLKDTDPLFSVSNIQ